MDMVLVACQRHLSSDVLTYEFIDELVPRFSVSWSFTFAFAGSLKGSFVGFKQLHKLVDVGNVVNFHDEDL